MRNNNLRLREIREQKSMTQDELAEATGLTQAAISAIERGEIKSPSLETARLIASALGVSVDELFPINDSAA